jgi:hypothetical protein
MPTDIRLDEFDGSWVIVDSAVLKSTAIDFLLDAPSRRGVSGGLRRALTHNGGDGLTINMSSDYPGGVTVESDLKVTGRLLLSPDGSSSVSDVISQLEDDIAELRLESHRFDPTRIDRLEQSVATLAALMNASVVPPWRTRDEVEQGDDMGILYMSASSLGFVVEYIVLQNDPQYNDGEVVQIEPPPGTVALRGSTVRVTINLAG